MLHVNPKLRITSAECLQHRWMKAADVAVRKRSVAAAAPVSRELAPAARSREELRLSFRVSQIAVRFVWRIANMRRLKQGVDRADLRARPYRNVEVRHEAEAAAFAVFGHWVSRGFHYSRDMLFANRPRPQFLRDPNS